MVTVGNTGSLSSLLTQLEASNISRIDAHQPTDIWGWSMDNLSFEVEVAEPDVTVVTIDVKPGSDTNCLNINGHGVIPVAIHGAAELDVMQIDQASLLFGGLAVRVRGNKGPLCSPEDVNGDDYLDLVCHFEDDASNWVAGDGEVTLTGTLFDKTPIEGSDSICIVP